MISTSEYSTCLRQDILLFGYILKGGHVGLLFVFGLDMKKFDTVLEYMVSRTTINKLYVHVKGYVTPRFLNM